jgi:uncharacterized YigZ family protein
MEGYPIPAEAIRQESIVVNSRFICAIGFADSVPSAQAFIQACKTACAEASSHAYAYRIGFGGSVIDGCNDGGEPSGTAGRPMLAVLQGSGLGDVTAVVSRYFGGTKLGTGGLVRAFGGAVKAALEVLPRTERIEKRDVLLEIAYPLFERVRLYAQSHGIEVLSQEFGPQVLLTLRIPVRLITQTRADLTEMSGGAASWIES